MLRNYRTIQTKDADPSGKPILSGEVRACACIKHLVQYVRGSPISWQLNRLLQEQQPELQRQSEEQRIRPEHSAGSFSVPSQPDP